MQSIPQWQNTGYFLQPHILCNRLVRKERDSTAFISYTEEGNMFYWTLTDVYLKLFGQSYCIGVLSMCVDASKTQKQDREAGLIEFQQQCKLLANDISSLNLEMLVTRLKDAPIAAVSYGKTTFWNQTAIYSMDSITVLPEYENNGLIIQLLDFISGELNVNVFSGNLCVKDKNVEIKLVTH